MLFSTKNNQSQHINLSIDNTPVSSEESLKFLGIHLDCKLQWDFHTSHVHKKISSGLYALRSLKHMLPTYSLNSLYYALIHPHLTYANIVWGNPLKKFLHPIEIAQKKALRSITRSQFNAPSNPLFKKLNILKLEDIHQTSLLHHMFKTHNNLTPSALCNLYNTHGNVHSLNTRHRHDFTIDRFQNSTAHRSFLLLGPKLWASLAPPLKQIRKFSIFKRQLKDSLILKYVS